MFEKKYSSTLKLVPKYLKNFGIRKSLRFFFYYIQRNKMEKKMKNVQKIIELDGYKLSIIPEDVGISSELQLFKTHEPLTTKLTLEILNEGMVCLDVGANIGYYAFLESKQVGDSGKVIAMEPSPRNFQQLKKNSELNNSSNVDIYNYAAGDKEGTVEFVVSKLSNLSKVVVPGRKIPEGCEIIQVPLIKIDSFIQEKGITNVDFVRMDVEGYEINVFDGMWDTIKKFKPIIQMEFHIPPIDQKEQLKFFTTLKDLGYEIKHYIPRAIDRPIVGEESDVKNYSIDEFIEMIKKKMLTYTFIIFLEQSK